MDMQNIEKKWQNIWKESNAHTFDAVNADKKYYVLEMFSYPSGAKLHAGHWYNYGPSDSFARFKKMQGEKVFQPMGFDAFGLPAENYAIKSGIHPKISTQNNIATMETQLQKIGAMFDWSKEIKTCEPEYYKWTQWMFLELFKNGLAYRKEAPVNWCNNCNTVLANEQVVDNACERCGTAVERKNLTQWFFKITKYADELLEGLDGLDWPEKTKLMQKNWIGKSVGGEIDFKIDASNDSFTVFTTRADTIMGVSYVVLAPEHPLVAKLTTSDKISDVQNYIEMSKGKTEIERLSTTREKTGVFIGSYAINPVNGKKVPIYAADYVLFSYGTGAVMGVPAHDERDFKFAEKYNLPITKVISSVNEDDTLPFTTDGVLVDSGKFTGLSSQDARKAILSELEKNKQGGFKINYRLRDWLVSRQRYWGTPIPIIHCEHCGEVAVPVADLPVKLPENVAFTPDGKSPLAKCDEFINTTCPNCGRPAKREADTLDTFVCSSWYFLRYPDANNDKEAFNSELINKILPVDKYIGGAEHACMHLLYARFFTKALRDMGYLNFDEPFKSLVHQGIILGTDGNKMSKSKGNVISPDTYVNSYGSDVFRLYLMFGFSYIEGGPWNDDGIKSIAKFLERAEKIIMRSLDISPTSTFDKKLDEELLFVLNNSIKNVIRDMSNFSFNTALARIMELTNALYKYDAGSSIDSKLFKDASYKLLLLLAPFVPHFAEEMNETLGNKKSIFDTAYPTFDESKLTLSEVEIAIQINSKVRGKINVPSNLSDAELENFAKSNEEITTLINGQRVVKYIIIKNRLINIVVAK